LDATKGQGSKYEFLLFLGDFALYVCSFCAALVPRVLKTLLCKSGICKFHTSSALTLCPAKDNGLFKWICDLRLATA
jgi:hypothetical protein